MTARRASGSASVAGLRVGADQLAERRRRLVEHRHPLSRQQLVERSGERLIRYGTTTSRPPWSSAPQISQTEKSNA